MLLKRIIISLFLFSFTASIYAVEDPYSSQIGIYDKKIDINNAAALRYPAEDSFISKTWTSIKKQLAESRAFLVITILFLLLCLVLILVWLFFAHTRKKIDRLMILIGINLAILGFINWLFILTSGLGYSQKFLFLLKDSIILFSVYLLGIKVGQLILRYRINAEKVP